MENGRCISNLKKHSRSISIGTFYVIIVLILRGIRPIIMNARPEIMTAEILTFQQAFWEIISFIPIFIFLYIRSRKHNSKYCRTQSEKMSDLNDRSYSMKFDQNSDQTFQFASFFKLSSKKMYLRVIIFGAIFSFSNYLYFLGIRNTGSILGVIAEKSGPIITLVFGFLFLGEKLSIFQLIIVIFNSIGLYYIGTEGSWMISHFDIWTGVLMLCPLFWVIANSMVKHPLEKEEISPLQAIFFRTFCEMIIFLIVNCIESGISTTISQIFEIDMIIWAIILGVTFVIAKIFWYTGLKYVDLSYGSAISTPTPIVTTIVSIIIFPATFVFPYQIVGMIWLLIGIYLLIFYKIRKAKKHNFNKSFSNSGQREVTENKNDS